VYVTIQLVNDIQTRIANLEKLGWTLAATARAIGVTPDTVGKWKRAERYPKPAKPIITVLDGLQKKKPPKKKLYPKR
jgi:transcriptional regulator with XRE-family HTH domain